MNSRAVCISAEEFFGYKGTIEMLPCEEDNKRLIRSDFAREFAGAESLQILARDILSAFGHGSWSQIGEVTKVVTLGIFTKAMKLHRAVLLLCEYALSETAEIVTRSLFESQLALRFILQDPRPRESCSLELVRQLDSLPPFPTDDSRSDFRAKLYTAAPVLRLSKHVEIARKDPQRSKLIGELRMGNAEMAADEAKIEIGPEWAKRLRSTNTYSGLQVKQLAEAYGLERYYVDVYWQQAIGAHGGDALRFVDADESSISTRLAPEPKELERCIFLATGIFGEIASELDAFFGLGFSDRINESASMFDECLKSRQESVNLDEGRRDSNPR